MKITTFILLMLLGSTWANAQFTKGTKMAGGNLGFRSFSTDITSNGTTFRQGTTTTFTFIPQVGYFIQDNLALGAGVNFTSSSYKPNGGASSQSATYILFSPFVRYYFPPRVYLQGSFDLGSSTITDTGGGKVTSSLLGWSLLAGYPVMLSESVALEPQLGYSSFTNKTDSSNKTVNGDFFLRFGLQVYLSRK